MLNALESNMSNHLKNYYSEKMQNIGLAPGSSSFSP